MTANQLSLSGKTLTPELIQTRQTSSNARINGVPSIHIADADPIGINHHTDLDGRKLESVVAAMQVSNRITCFEIGRVKGNTKQRSHRRGSSVSKELIGFAVHTEGQRNGDDHDHHGNAAHHLPRISDYRR